MWDQHWCQGATRRVGELAPAMNRAVAAARAKGVLIIHAPSSCMDAYKDHPARKRAQAAPKAANLPERHRRLVQQDPRRGEGRLSRSTSPTAAATTARMCPQGSPWKSQIAAIEIRDEDAISDSGVEIWNLLESRGITNVHAHGRSHEHVRPRPPFGLRQLVRHGKNVVLVRDLTDTMYNSRTWPYVSHFEGTDRIVEHIEKFVAPTITSTDLTGQPAVPVQARRPPPRRVPDRRGRIQDREDPAGLRRQGAGAAGDPLHVRDRRPEDAARLPGRRGARRRRPAGPERPPPRPDGRSRWRSSAAISTPGKPVVGIRTACHAFDTRGKAPPGHAEWTTFDPDVLGGHYTGHHGNDLKPVIDAAGERREPSRSSTVSRRRSPARARSTRRARWRPRPTPLLMGTIPGQPAEPVAWVNLKGTPRVFYTSLGHPGDFATPAFRRLLRNAVFWALDRPTDPAKPRRPRHDGAALRL